MNLIREAINRATHVDSVIGTTFLTERALPEATDDGYLYASNVGREYGFVIMFTRSGNEYVASRRSHAEPIRQRFMEYASGPLEIPIHQRSLCV